MGSYSSSFGAYADHRRGGYEYNYGVPAFKASDWVRILYNPSGLDVTTRIELNHDLAAVNAVLIFIGGNDLSLANNDAQNDLIRQSIASIHDYIRNNAPANLPIIIATVPDIGATPKEKLSDPTAAAAARQRVATLNANIIALGSRPNTYIARIDNLTDLIFDLSPFHLNGTEFIYSPNPQNPPLHIFCKDGFHPATAAQALIANEILKAINLFSTTPIPLISNREILSQILSLNPDQPFINFIASNGTMSQNPDNDSLPNLLEFLLDTNPASPNEGISFLTNGTASFTPSPNALRFASLTVLQSPDLQDNWTQVPQPNMIPQPDGSIKILPTAPKLFYKFLATPNP
jgi:lysophospholipase L1-like esterase